MDLYQQYIHKSRYSRYLDEKKRRETWDETVARYFNFLDKHLKTHYQHELDRHRLEKAVRDLAVMPSMRALMTAGKALERDNTAGYNCSFIPVDDPKAFDEALHILACGTGVGFSVEQRYIDKLPEVPDRLFSSETVIVVRDSKEGWAKALRQLIALLYAGEVPYYDMSRVRKKGARLKTFGGRASGPEPLMDLFKFTIQLFKKAAGRKLTSLECHDLMCKIAEVIVVGGVRRSALISLSDLEDDRMREAKSGQWWVAHAQRALANNSAVYETKPDIGLFMKEWHSLYASFSGERGLFSRYASKMIAGRNGRRDVNWDFGTNPCSEIILRMLQFCNLTSVVIRPGDNLETLKEKVRIATILGTYQATLTHFPYLRKMWKKNTEEERLLGVSLTGICDHDILSQVSDEAAYMLEEMRKVAIETNLELSKSLGIPPSSAITAVKPEGNSSQLNNSSSGLHTRYSRYYIRRVRNDKKDPLSQFMIDNGIPYEEDLMNPSVYVFSFPREAPEHSLLRDSKTAIEQLELWKQYQDHWCEHKPSVTIYVKEEEWLDVGAWVYRHFDNLSGVSFLPWDGGTYRQAPYEEIDQKTYLDMSSKMPLHINWDDLVEEEDNVEGVQTLSCTSGACEL